MNWEYSVSMTTEQTFKTTTLAILHAIACSPNGLSFTDMQRIAYKRAHPDREFGPDVRGFWCSPLTGSYGAAFYGYITKGANRRYYLSAEGKDKLLKAMLTMGGPVSPAAMAPKTNKRAYWVTLDRNTTYVERGYQIRIDGAASASEAMERAIQRARSGEHMPRSSFPREDDPVVVFSARSARPA